MADFESEYTGEEVEAMLAKTSEVNVAAVDTGTTVDDVILEYATTQYVEDAIASAITTTLNTEV